jgi:hypothetical protein
MFTTSSKVEQNLLPIYSAGNLNGNKREPMIVHIVVYIMLMSIYNCCAAINIHLFILFILDIRQIEVKQTLLIPYNRKIKAKRTLLIQELKKIKVN